MVIFREYQIKNVDGQYFSLNLPKGTEILGVDSDTDEDVHFLALVESEEKETEERKFISFTRQNYWWRQAFPLRRVVLTENIKFIGFCSYKMMWKTVKIYVFEIM